MTGIDACVYVWINDCSCRIPQHFQRYHNDNTIIQEKDVTFQSFPYKTRVVYFFDGRARGPFY